MVRNTSCWNMDHTLLCALCVGNLSRCPKLGILSSVLVWVVDYKWLLCLPYFHLLFFQIPPRKTAASYRFHLELFGFVTFWNSNTSDSKNLIGKANYFVLLVLPVFAVKTPALDLILSCVSIETFTLVLLFFLFFFFVFLGQSSFDIFLLIVSTQVAKIPWLFAFHGYGKMKNLG